MKFLARAFLAFLFLFSFSLTASSRRGSACSKIIKACIRGAVVGATCGGSWVLSSVGEEKESVKEAMLFKLKTLLLGAGGGAFLGFSYSFIQSTSEVTGFDLGLPDITAILSRYPTVKIQAATSKPAAS